MRSWSAGVFAVAIKVLSCCLLRCSGLGCGVDGVWPKAATVMANARERTNSAASVRFMEISLIIQMLMAMRTARSRATKGYFDCCNAGRFLDSKDFEEQ